MDYPSILKQTKWRSGFFEFGKAQANKDIRYFNPSLVEHNGHDWLVARKAQPRPGDPFGMNTIWAFKLDDQHRPLQGILVAFKDRYPDQHHEDPRIIRLPNGKMLLSYTTFVLEPKKGWYGAHQGCAVLGAMFQPEQVLDPIYGRNGGSVLMNSGNEKNWLWFWHDGALHMIYNTDPVHEVIRWNQNLGVVRKYETKDHVGLFAKYGQPRGGTPPVLIGDEYWSFFHSSVLWKDPKRRYFMGAYAFEAKAPFRVTRMTRKPLLAGSQNDPWVEGQPLVVFPCGAIFRNNQWFVSMGINDMASAWIEIPHDELVKLTKPINETVVSIQEIVKETEDRVKAESAVQPNIATVETGQQLNGVAVAVAIDTSDAGVVRNFEGQRPVESKPSRRRIRRRRATSLRRNKRVQSSVESSSVDG